MDIFGCNVKTESVDWIGLDYGNLRNPSNGGSCEDPPVNVDS